MGTVNIDLDFLNHDKNISVHLVETAADHHDNALSDKNWLLHYYDTNKEKNGTLVKILDNQKKTLAAAIVVPAEDSQFARLSKLDSNALNRSIFIAGLWVSPDTDMASSLAGILYFALRRGRILGKKSVVSFVPTPNTEMPLRALLKMDPLSNLPKIKLGDLSLLAVAQHIDYSIAHVYELCEGDMLDLVKENFATEVVETHARWLKQFYNGEWAQSVINKTMTKEQYISSMFSLHEYVRQTTRLCARCVAYSEDLRLRNHYINHFKGEINHELIIERDLKNLGADVEFLKKQHVPHQATKEFMVVQESTVGFYQDPVMMLACPMTAEGVAANMDSRFLDALYDCIAKWGIDKPIEAARFFTSHISTDGGDDGHWANVIRMIKEYIQDEHKLQQFLSVLYAAMKGFENSFNANITELKLWSALPATGNKRQRATQ